MWPYKAFGIERSMLIVRLVVRLAWFFLVFDRVVIVVVVVVTHVLLGLSRGTKFSSMQVLCLREPMLYKLAASAPKLGALSCQKCLCAYAEPYIVQLGAPR